jgi:hypothetical protein
VYDRVDSDVWLDHYEARGRATNEELSPENEGFTGEKNRRTGGSMSFCQKDAEYAKALSLKTLTPQMSTLLP